MTDLEALVVAAYVFADEYRGPCSGGPAGAGQRRGAGRARGLSGGDRDQLRPAVPRPGRAGVAGLVSASARPVAVQPPLAGAGRADLDRAAAARPLARHAAVCGSADGTQLAVANYPGCQQRMRVRRLRPLRLLEVTAPLRLGRAARAADRRARHCRSATRSCPQTRRSTSRSPTSHRHPGRGRDRRQRPLGPRLPRTARRRRHRLLTPDKTRTAANLGRERALASTRLVIESVFANLKGQMRLERHLAKTPAGLAVRIAQRILALTIGILLNTLTGRPARALAAYDGR